MPRRPAGYLGGGQGVRSDPESEGFEEKYRAVIDWGEPRMNRSARAPVRFKTSVMAAPTVCRASDALCVAGFRFAFAFNFLRGAGAVSSASSSRSVIRRSAILASSSVIFARMCSIDVFMARCLSRERRVVAAPYAPAKPPHRPILVSFRDSQSSRKLRGLECIHYMNRRRRVTSHASWFNRLSRRSASGSCAINTFARPLRLSTHSAFALAIRIEFWSVGAASLMIR